ncbi:MAG: integrase, partial [bacterium]|nr:integrase [bacterium]
MATIKYLLQSKSESAPIYLRLSISRNKNLKRKTGLHINPKDWSKATGLPKQNNSDNKNLTTDLKDLSLFILKSLNDANIKGIEITGEWLLHNIEVYYKRA